MDQSAVNQDSKLKELENNLFKYRSYLLALNKVFEWEPAYIPGVLILVLTIVFSITWYVEPTVITAFSILCILACLLDFAAPFVSNQLYKNPDDWNEEQYKRVCERLLNGKNHIELVWGKLLKLRTEKPNTFLLTMMGTFLTLAWIGSLIDTLLLVYLFVVIATMVPGLRKHGILQQAGEFIKSKLKKPKKQ